jgi:hypothetical protein
VQNPKKLQIVNNVEGGGMWKPQTLNHSHTHTFTNPKVSSSGVHSTKGSNPKCSKHKPKVHSPKSPLQKFIAQNAQSTNVRSKNQKLVTQNAHNTKGNKA